MKKVLQLTNPNVYADYVNAPVLHPLVSIVHLDELAPFRRSLIQYSVYGLFFQKSFPENLSYGMKTYRAGPSSVIAVAPGQIGGVEDDGELISRSGWVLFWSSELFHGTAWEKEMEAYRFFSYFSVNSLPLSGQEWELLSGLIGRMRSELQEKEDTPALRGILRGYLHLILEYCNSVYLEQVFSENRDSTDILKRFHQMLTDYYADNRQVETGVPTVTFCASWLAYSPRYLGDVVHKVTGGTAIGYIHAFVVERGKSLLMQGYNVSETAHLLGFEYVHHFNRVFKKVTGITPGEYLGR